MTFIVDLDSDFSSFPAPDLSRVGAVLWFLFKGCFACFKKINTNLLALSPYCEHPEGHIFRACLGVPCGSLAHLDEWLPRTELNSEVKSLLSIF